LKDIYIYFNTNERRSAAMQNNRTITLISHASKVLVKAIQARMEAHMKRELPMYKQVSDVDVEPGIKYPICIGFFKDQKNINRIHISAS